MLTIGTYQGLCFLFIHTRLVCKYSKGDRSFTINFSMCLDFVHDGKRILLDALNEEVLLT